MHVLNKAVSKLWMLLLNSKIIIKFNYQIGINRVWFVKLQFKKVMQLECGEKLIRLILINSVAQFKNQLIMQYHKKIGEAVFEIW